MQNNSPQDKVALVTGGAQRLGAVIAARLHSAGMRLVVHYRSSDDAAHTLQDSLNKKRKESVVLVKGELLDVDKCRHLVNQCIQTFGRLDVIVNNASTFHPTPVGDTTTDEWESLMGINLRAPFFLVQEAAPELKKNRGCVVNMADVYGRMPLKDHIVYSTAKAGLIALTRALATELAPNVRVNAVAPGAILWPEGDGNELAHQRLVSNTPLKRIGSPDEIADAVLFLVTGAGFTSGHVLPVDGGRSV
ncbi:MAG: Glucose 1-dehydrogenase [Gammaproteobacteria bacterium]|nr:Glucose 1-dehydrogenase [Gammaproteobacteria bacterium]